MKKVYDEIVKFMITSGKRIVKRAGKIKDIGVAKKDLTEEDLAIERGLKEIIQKHYPSHQFFAEEEHDSLPKGDDIWIADPISGTRAFLDGLPHYGIVIAYAKNKVVQFSAVYDPSVDELFIAFKGEGAFLNGKKISVSDKKKPKVIFNLSKAWKDGKSSKKMTAELEKFTLIRNRNSHAVNMGYVACGRVDGIVSFCKDSFPSFAGSLLIQEAGGVFTNDKGDSYLHYEDRVFIGGSKG
ncbi:MAG: inositol monophosphatase, partial [Candidatus Woesearchaeota archaeon]|nr:inositol monophosphatase [Candidatus Woesearchaeota archaeon]